jgi:aminopeptidase YwaD
MHVQIRRINHDFKSFLLKTISLVLIIGFASSSTSFAQDTTYARSIVNKLASYKFKGRGYASNGDKIAASYISSEFAKAGLIPLQQHSYFQPYHLSVNTFPGKVQIKLDGVILKTAVDYLIDASCPSVKGKFNIFTISRADLSSKRSLANLLASAANSFVLLDNIPAQEETSAQKVNINSNLEQLQFDQSLIFKGLLISTSDKLTWTTSSNQSFRPVIILNKPGFEPKLAKVIDLDIQATWIKDYETQNVVGMIKGSSPTDSMLVVTAHYDHLGLMGKNVYFPGANDNASGTAMLLSLIQHYAIHRPKYSMVFIAFSGEEIGLLGSKAFIEHPLIDLNKIRFLVNFDLAGTGEEGIRVVNGTIFNTEFEKINALNTQYKLMKKVDIRGEACNSDHCLFYQAGVPDFFIYTQGGIKAYHDIYDRSETLPLTAFKGYFVLMTRFLDTF